jgi:hypothetical protein
MSSEPSNRENLPEPAFEAAGGVCFDESLAGAWYEVLQDEVDYHCSFCEGLHMNIEEMQTKVREAYASTARSMKGLHDVKEIANRWLAMWSFSTTLLATATIAKESHQICGADLSELQKFHDAAKERFLLHCPHTASV